MRRRNWFAYLLLSVLSFSIIGTSLGQSVLTEVKRSGVLRVGIATTQPGAFKDIRTDDWTGINVEVARRMAELMGAKLEIVETSFDLFLPALNAGDFDIFMPGTFYTVTRALQARFSTPAYFKGVTAVVRADDNRFSSIEDFNNPDVTIAVRLGAVEADLVPLIFPKARVLEFRTDEAATIAQAVSVGNADVWVADQVLQSQYLATNAWAKVVGAAFGKSPISYVMRYGDPDWSNFVDNFVLYMRSSGEMRALLERFGQDTSTMEF